ncbi:MAG: TetR family transcriptional regulator [Phenylobacterium sp.]|uniref:TetR/AcrR family transcriptional regulator n=1 Tax=Phenylobacterium sp. TaxID=1871053 RepID=UPI0027371BE7|nr:TetR/AcrR family transcriptional regulator [Phenylobacterium sp.]MDP3749334.1 TetR family transcriptional regulator [Phenylobacterium sp.]
MATVATRRRTNKARRGESQEKILDAAEALLATHGFNGVSIKDIATAAEVDASLLHYYFATKAGLHAAVIARRADEVNASRLASMQRYAETAAGHFTVEGVLRAYLEPTFAFVRTPDAGRLSYLTLIAQLNSTPTGVIPGAEVTPFDPVIQVFIKLLREASPASSDEDLYWFYHMLSGAISVSWARTGRIDRLSGGLCRSDDFESIARHMIALFAEGLTRDRAGGGVPSADRR